MNGRCTMICVQCHLHQYFTWIKEGVDHAWKGWITKHLDWGPNPCAPYASTRSPCYLWYKEPRRPSLIRFGKVDSDSRNSLHQNHHRDHIWTPFWTFFIWMKDKKITFPMDLVSCPNTILFHVKHQNNEVYIIC
jgi:formate-dependent nitrite reductase cytochrome c552 subunit